MPQEVNFDPYHKWLGIPQQYQPPDHYRLLGLEAFEPDPDVIQAAAERQMAHIQSYKIGPQSDLSQRVLNEIAKAKVCLVNPTSKAEYDRTLRQRLTAKIAAPTPPPTPMPQMQWHPAPAQTELVSDISDVAPTRRTLIRRKRGPDLFPVLVGGAIALCLIAAVVAFVVSSSSENWTISTRPSDETPPNDKQPDTTAEDFTGRGDEQRDKKKFAVPSENQLAIARKRITLHGDPVASDFLDAAASHEHAWIRYAYLKMCIDKAVEEGDTEVGLKAVEELIRLFDVPDPVALRQQTIASFPTPSPPTTPAPPPVVPASQRGEADDNRRRVLSSNSGRSAVQLPGRSNTNPTPIAELQYRPVATSNNKLEIDLVQPDGNPAKFRLAAAEGSGWSITLAENEIARLFWHGQTLDFQWIEGAPDDAECLRNTALRIHEGKSSIILVLREALKLKAPVIDLSKQRLNLPIDAPLWGLDQRSLLIEAKTVDGPAQVVGLLPANGRAALGAGSGAGVRMALRDRPPSAGIHLALLGGSKQVSVRLEPKFIDFAGEEQPWTEVRLKGFHTGLIRLIQQHEQGLPTAEANEKSLDEKLRKHIALYGDNRGSQIIIAERAALSQGLEKAKRAHAALQTALPVNKQRLAAVVDLQQLADAVHKSTTTPFRVFYELAGEEVDIARAE